MSIKIQINSLEALERLIGGDSELEIEIRNSIVQEFSRQYLKPIAITQQFQTTLTNIQKQASSVIQDKVNEEVWKKYFDTDWCNRPTQVKSEYVAKIKECIKKNLDLILKEEVKKAIDNLDKDRFFDGMMHEYLYHKLTVPFSKKLEEVYNNAIKNVQSEMLKVTVGEHAKEEEIK